MSLLELACPLVSSVQPIHICFLVQSGQSSSHADSRIPQSNRSEFQAAASPHSGAECQTLQELHNHRLLPLAEPPQWLSHPCLLQPRPAALICSGHMCGHVAGAFLGSEHKTRFPAYQEGEVVVKVITPYTDRIRTEVATSHSRSRCQMFTVQLSPSPFK